MIIAIDLSQKSVFHVASTALSSSKLKPRVGSRQFRRLYNSVSLVLLTLVTHLLVGFASGARPGHKPSNSEDTDLQKHGLQVSPSGMWARVDGHSERKRHQSSLLAPASLQTSVRTGPSQELAIEGTDIGEAEHVTQTARVSNLSFAAMQLQLASEQVPAADVKPKACSSWRDAWSGCFWDREPGQNRATFTVNGSQTAGNLTIHNQWGGPGTWNMNSITINGITGELVVLANGVTRIKWSNGIWWQRCENCPTLPQASDAARGTTEGVKSNAAAAAEDVKAKAAGAIDGAVKDVSDLLGKPAPVAGLAAEFAKWAAAGAKSSPTTSTEKAASTALRTAVPCKFVEDKSLTNVGTALAQNLQQHDVASLKETLRRFAPVLRRPANISNLSCVEYVPFVQEPDGTRVTVLAFGASIGWLPGVQTLVDWYAAEKNIRAVGLDADGANSSPLLRAVRAGHADVVHHLVKAKASPIVADLHNNTPLEVAVREGPASVVAALLNSNCGLEHELLPLRVYLARQARKLPSVADRWSLIFATEQTDGMQPMREAVPMSLRPQGTDLYTIGDHPSDWVLFYTNRVMIQYISSAATGKMTSSNTLDIEHLLAVHGYDAFARSFSTSVVLSALFLAMVFIPLYLIFRIRIFGGLDVPVSLAHMLPGAFDPGRLADPDFDPTRQKSKLPYRMVKDHLPPSSVSAFCGAANIALLFQGICGVFHSWSLLCVRIPPENNPYDEDYESGDDDLSRSHVRNIRVDQAHTVQNVEITVRTFTLILVLWWLVHCSMRWDIMAVVVAVYGLSTLIAAGVRASSEPAPCPERTPDDGLGFRTEEGTVVDNTCIVNALFNVQYGPRWVRSLVITRSSASPNKGRNRRNRRLRQKRNAEGNQSNNEEKQGDEKPNEEQPSFFIEGSAGTPYSDSFQRLFLQVGLMHIPHREFLWAATINLMIIALALLWLSHLQYLFGNYLSAFYRHQTPLSMFNVYGTAMSAQRWFAILIELALLVLVGERIYSVASVLMVAALTLQQRQLSLAFVSQHSPLNPSKPGDTAGLDCTATLTAALQRVDEFLNCSRFALELSSLRWAVLKPTVMVVLLAYQKCLAYVIITLTIGHFRSSSKYAEMEHWMIAAPCCIIMCLTFPVLGTLVAAAATNRELRQQRELLWSDTDTVTSKMQVSDFSGQESVLYTKLRVKANEALWDEGITWPGGREIGFFEPLLIIILVTIAVLLLILFNTT